MPTDILGRELKVDDFIVYYSKLYQIIDTFPIGRNSFVRIELVEKSKTTKPVNKMAKECCLVDRDAVIVHLLKNGKV